MGFWDDIFKGQPTGAANSLNAGDAAAFFNANDAEKVRRIPGTSDADIANGGAGSQFERNYAGTDGTSQGLNALGSPAAAAKKKSAGVETSAVSAKYNAPDGNDVIRRGATASAAPMRGDAPIQSVGPQPNKFAQMNTLAARRYIKG